MRRGRVLTTVALVGGLLLAGSVAAAADSGPTISLSTSTVRPGDTIVVTLTGWPDVTTVAICGNAAARGAVDCDQVSSVGVPTSKGGPAQQLFRIAVPPAPCPCVVRASTAGGTTVKTVPIAVVGAANAPVKAAPVAGAPTITVSARVIHGNHSLFDGLRSALAGPTRRTLVLRVANIGSAPLAGLSVTAAVGRDTQGGEPLQPPNVDLLQPGETRAYRLDVSLGAPSFGSYDVFGTVYGAGAPVSFAASTSTEPWGLFLVVVVFLADLVAMGYFRIRRRRDDDALPHADEKATAKQTEVEQTRPSFRGGEPADMVGGDALQNT